MKTRIISRALPLLMAAAFMTLPCAPARADDWYGSAGGYFTVQDERGQILFRFAGTIYTDDEYISGDNKRYRVVETDEAARRAVARFVEDVQALAPSAETLSNAADWKPTVAIYCTHSDESYEPTDGTESQPENGGIMDVAARFQQYLEQLGCDVVRSDTSHEPHDAGAYRRSRSTAVQLMEQSQPNMLCDIHRDAVPAEDYEVTVEGESASGIRIVIGRSNQNKNANEEFARTLKQIADERYPGLIKDIYIGKGTYNQDLMPQAMLFEVGTSTIDKDRAENATRFLANVVAAALGAGGAAGTGQSPSGTAQAGVTPSASSGVQQQSAQERTTANTNKGAWTSILWTLLALAVVAGVTLLVTVRRGQFGAKVGGFFREITGIGRKRGRDDPRNRM